NPRLDQWIAFQDGKVMLRTGKVEIGQGALTALAQIAAEELDVPPERLHVISGETPACPSEGFTSGSNSIVVSGSAVRLVCAEVGALSLRRGADDLGCAPDHLAIADGRVFRAGQPTGHDYWSHAIDLARPATGSVPVKPPSDYAVVGHDLPRIDLPRKVLGAAFIHDLAPENVLHARMLRPPWRGARLVALDEAAVRRAAGAPIEVLREGDLVAFPSEHEFAVMRPSPPPPPLALCAAAARPPPA